MGIVHADTKSPPRGDLTLTWTAPDTPMVLIDKLIGASSLTRCGGFHESNIDALMLNLSLIIYPQGC